MICIGNEHHRNGEIGQNRCHQLPSGQNIFGLPGPGPKYRNRRQWFYFIEQGGDHTKSKKLCEVAVVIQRSSRQ